MTLTQYNAITATLALTLEAVTTSQGAAGLIFSLWLVTLPLAAGILK